jgi:hypothetical protein
VCFALLTALAVLVILVVLIVAIFLIVLNVAAVEAVRARIVLRTVSSVNCFTDNMFPFRPYPL